MKLTEKEKLQESISELRCISESLFHSGDIRRGQDLRNVVNHISSILKKMEIQ